MRFMKHLSGKKWFGAKVALTGVALAGSINHSHAAPTSTDDPLIEALIQKGILTPDEADKIRSEVATRETNMISATFWRM